MWAGGPRPYVPDRPYRRGSDHHLTDRAHVHAGDLLQGQAQAVRQRVGEGQAAGDGQAQPLGAQHVDQPDLHPLPDVVPGVKQAVNRLAGLVDQDAAALAAQFVGSGQGVHAAVAVIGHVAPGEQGQI